MRNTSRLLWAKLGEMLMDGFFVFLAFPLAYFLRIGPYLSTDFPFWPYLQLAALLTPAFVLLLAVSGVYSLGEQSPLSLLRKIILSCFAGVALFALIYFFKREIFYSRLMILLAWGLSSLLVFAFHVFLERWKKRRYQQGKDILRTLIIGNKNAAAFIAKKLKKNGSMFQVVVALSPYGGGPKTVGEAAVLGKLDALERVTKEERIDALIQTEAVEHTISIIAFAEANALDCLVAPQILGIFDRRFLAEHIGGLPFIRLQISPLFGWGQFWKRGFDLLLSGIALIFLSPLFLFWKTEKNSFAKGTGKEVFQKYVFAKREGFPRFLAELINVFLGDMSLVGPRPRSAAEREQLTLHERKRLLVKPGLVGLWQMERLKGERGDTEEEMLQDLQYIRQWSFWRDIGILGKSLYLLLSPGATNEKFFPKDTP